MYHNNIGRQSPVATAQEAFEIHCTVAQAIPIIAWLPAECSGPAVCGLAEDFLGRLAGEAALAPSEEVGDAALTTAGELSAKFVVHAAGMPPGGSASEESIRSSLRRSFQLALENGCRTLAAPAIGTGIGGFPPQRCAEILFEEARAHMAGEPCLDEIRFVLLGEPTYRIFESVNDAARVQEQLARMKAARK